MPVGYVTRPGAVVQRVSQRLVVSAEGQTIAQWPLIHLEGLVVVGGVSVTTPALVGLARAGITTAFVSGRGELLAKLAPVKAPGIGLRMAQYRLAEDGARRLSLSRRIVERKVAAMADLFDRQAANYAEPALRRTRDELQQRAEQIRRVETLASMRGVEGACAAVYWGAFGLLNRSNLPFGGRSTRPPRDPVNALLGAGYMLLAREIIAGVEAIGLDSGIGFYHDLGYDRPALALDLMEPYRHRLVDRLVLRLINLRRVRADDFQGEAGGGVYLAPRGWQILLTQWEEAVREPPDEPDQPPADSWRTALCDQWTRFARWLRGKPRGAASGASGASTSASKGHDGDDDDGYPGPRALTDADLEETG